MSTREEIENMKQRFQHLLRDAAITDDEICHEVWDQHVKLKEKYSMDVGGGRMVKARRGGINWSLQGDPLYWLAAAILLEHLERDREINMIKLFKSSRLRWVEVTVEFLQRLFGEGVRKEGGEIQMKRAEINGD